MVHRTPCIRSYIPAPYTSQEEMQKALAQSAADKLEWEKQRRLQTEIEATQAAVKEKARREVEEAARLAKVEADRELREASATTSRDQLELEKDKERIEKEAIAAAKVGQQENDRIVHENDLSAKQATD